jgi:hypothetical protein
MMTESAKLDSLVTTLLRELEAVRSRMLHAREGSIGGETALMAAALSEEVEHLCREAAACGDRTESEALLAKSRRCLDQLQKVLGVH